MSELRHSAEEIVAAMQVAAAAQASIRRHGSQDLEAERRANVRGLVRASRALARELSQFADCAGAHGEGIHCSARMDTEVAALNEALADFIYAARQAGGPSPEADKEVDVPLTRSPASDAGLLALHANWLPLRLPVSPPS